MFIMQPPQLRAAIFMKIQCIQTQAVQRNVKVLFLVSQPAAAMRFIKKK